jgi:hypothetical protein
MESDSQSLTRQTHHPGIQNWTEAIQRLRLLEWKNRVEKPIAKCMLDDIGISGPIFGPIPRFQTGGRVY